MLAKNPSTVNDYKQQQSFLQFVVQQTSLLNNTEYLSDVLDTKSLWDQCFEVFNRLGIVAAQLQMRGAE